MKQKVSIEWDRVTPLATSFHKAILIPGGAEVPLYPHVEAEVMIHWSPGMAAHQNKLTGNVLHQGQRIALAGHDCGMRIPHVNVPIPPVNALLPDVLFKSSRKMLYSASTVKMNGAPTGTSDLLAFPTTPMTICNDPVSIPMAFPLVNAFNSVNVGMTFADFLAGSTALVLQWASGIAGSKMKSGLGKDALKDALAVATGVVKVLLYGEGTIELGWSGPFYDLKVKASRKKDGTWSFGGRGRVVNEKREIEYDSGRSSKPKRATTGTGRPTTRRRKRTRMAARP